MPDYAQGKVYRIVCDKTGLQYIGSTTQPLSYRFAGHKRNHKNWVENGKQENAQRYTSVHVIDGGAASCVLIENFPCASKEELKARERHFIETMDCVNKQTPGRTHTEYRIDNRDTQNGAT